MSKIVFSGLVYGQKPTGIYRYANEILMEIDKMTSKDEVTLVVPEYAKNIPEFHTEIYGDTVTYIDPYKPAANLVVYRDEEKTKKLLEKYSLHRSATQMLSYFRILRSDGKGGNL